MRCVRSYAGTRFLAVILIGIGWGLVGTLAFLTSQRAMGDVEGLIGWLSLNVPLIVGMATSHVLLATCIGALHFFEDHGRRPEIATLLDIKQQLSQQQQAPRSSSSTARLSAVELQD